MVGTTISHYRILRPLGAGGMGEVYSATDTRLGREVAIKVLPADLARDPERLARFEREAQAVAALSHPHIVTLYEVGESDSGPFLVLEKIDGSSLRSVLARGPLALRRVLSLSAQIADGLAKAHGAGVVHRDLKPENVMVSSDGVAKVLDFGLAKLLAKDPDELTNATTVAHDTDTGIVVGTVGYLSPEQAAGRPVDFRADQFAFGTLVYEMATGEQPFRRPSSAESLAAVLRDEAPSLRDKRPDLPAQLGWILERCLAKDPADRYASTRDLARDLADLRDRLSEIGSDAMAAISQPPQRRRNSVAWALAGVAFGLLLATIAFLSLRPRASTSAAELPTFQQLTFRRGYLHAARFSADGATVVYSAAWDGRPPRPFSARLDGVESREIGASGTHLLALSAHGQLALALDWDTKGRSYGGMGTLAVAPLGGGGTRELARRVIAADWAPNGTRLAVACRQQGRTEVQLPLGHRLYVPEQGVTGLRVSPRGDRVAVIEEVPEGYAVVAVDLGGKRTALSTGWNRALGLAWAKGGNEVWFTAARSGKERALYAVDLRGHLREVARFPGGFTLHDIAADGTVLLSQENIRREMVALAPGAAEEQQLTWLDYSFPVDLSPDGRQILFTEGAEGRRNDGQMYLRATDGSPAVRLGISGEEGALSPDGAWALVVSSVTNGLRYRLVPTGVGESRELVIPGLSLGDDVAWFPSGDRILFDAREPGRDWRSFTIDVHGGTPQPVTPEGDTALAVSPDGGRLLVAGLEGWEIIPLGGGAPEILPWPQSDGLARFGDGGRAAYFFLWGQSEGHIERLDLVTGHHQLWRLVRPADPAGVISVLPRAVSADGRAFVGSYVRILSTLYAVRGLH